MSQVITILLPIFGLILAGFICQRAGCLGDNAASELNRFVVWLCLPALLFQVTATATVEQIWHPNFILGFTLTTLLVFGAVVLWKWHTGRSLADASIDGLAAGYANTGYVGIPMCLFVFGGGGLEPALVASLIVVCVLFSIAIVLIEVGLQVGQSAGQAMVKVLLALLKNPLVVAPIVGGLWAYTGWTIPQTADTFLTLLGDATVPCALVSLGAFLAHKQEGSFQGAWPLIVIKLVVHPLLTWVMVFHLFQASAMWAKAAVLLSALPTGTGPYMLAQLYGREASIASRTTLISTIASIGTLSVCLIWMID